MVEITFSNNKENDMKTQTRTQVNKSAKMDDSLVGKYFYTFEPEAEGKPRRVKCQGKVCGRPREDLYLAQFFEWFAGSPSNMQMISLDDMKDWKFFADQEDRDAWWERNRHKYAP